ncbi:DUF805 domain-containing protein [Aeromonas bestiarum]|uniref:DUF805 domain-containing protein n=1 Tax=Aeromonas bestiarum TaxID=105751 RepID=UPI000501D6D9|nr:DUF805 domain-containing protein [Aeromonas bestiarum]KFN21240.1 hypothetical protein JM66_00445 [Aeromonas bestiarum]
MCSFYLLAWRRYADFSGRSSRKEFWMFMLVHVLVTLMCIALDVGINGLSGLEVGYSVVSTIPMIAVIVRRLHDIDRSGWWGWIFFVPGVGPFVLIYLLARQACSGHLSVREAS